MTSDPQGHPAADEIVLALPGDPHAPALARQFVTDHGDDVIAAVLDDARLLASELVCNAVRHGRPAIVLRLRRSDAGVQVSVEDNGDAFAATDLPKSDESQTSGRGLDIVAALSTSWGVQAADLPPGKTVWCEVRSVPPAA